MIAVDSVVCLLRFKCQRRVTIPMKIAMDSSMKGLVAPVVDVTLLQMRFAMVLTTIAMAWLTKMHRAITVNSAYMERAVVHAELM